MIIKKVKPKQGRRASFAACIRYVCCDRNGRVWMRGVFSIATAAIAMESVAMLNTRPRSAVRHLLICYAKGENPTSEQILADIERLLDSLDMADHQFVAKEHTDTDNLHVHIVANRVGDDGKCANSSFDYKIHETVSVEIGVERDWEVVNGRHNAEIIHSLTDRQHVAPERRLTDGEYLHQYRTGNLAWQDRVRPIIMAAVAEADSWVRLAELLVRHGIVVRCSVNVRKKDGKKFPGLAFREGEAENAPRCGASKISDVCKYSTLAGRFGPWPDFSEEILKAPEATQDDPDGTITTDERADQALSVPVLLSTAAEDAQALQVQHQLHLQAQRDADTKIKQIWNDAWTAEKAKRREEKKDRDKSYKGRRREARTFNAKLQRRVARIDASQRWRKTMLPPRPVKRIYRQFVADLAASGNEAASRHLIWLSRGTAKLDTVIAADLGRGTPTVYSIEATARPNIDISPSTTSSPAFLLPASRHLVAQSGHQMSVPALRTPSPRQGSLIRLGIAALWNRVRKSLSGRLGWSSPDHQRMMADILSHARRVTEKELNRAITTFNDETAPAWNRARAAVEAETKYRQLDQDSTMPPIVAGRAVGDLLRQAVRSGTEQQFYKELVQNGWIRRGLREVIAHMVQATVGPMSKHPALTTKAQHEWSHMQGPPTAFSALAALKRLATAQAREEPDSVVDMLKLCRDDILSHLSEQDWRSLEVRLPGEVERAKLEAQRDPATYGKRSEIFTEISRKVTSDKQAESLTALPSQTHENLR